MAYHCVCVDGHATLGIAAYANMLLGFHSLLLILLMQTSCQATVSDTSPVALFDHLGIYVQSVVEKSLL